MKRRYLTLPIFTLTLILVFTLLPVSFISANPGNFVNNEIYLMNTDGSEQTRITNNSADDWVPCFSPDGTKIAFTSERDGNSEIYVMDADGNNQRKTFHGNRRLLAVEQRRRRVGVWAEV